MREFYGCYLLVSKAPQAKGRTYIGFTVNPRRRIRQHNGLITAGAWKTSRYRPWEMTLVLYGFPTKVQALQFEWAWQNPQRSVTVRPIAEALGARKMAGLRGKILLMLSMLHESPWRYFPLTLQYLQPEYADMVKETVVSAPMHVRVFTAPLDQVPKAINDEERDDDEDVGASGDEENGDGENLQAAPDANPPQATSPRSSALASSDTCAAAGPGTAASTSSGAGQTCHICRSVIERHSLFCTACRVTFHLECLATRWVNTERAGAEEDGGVLDRNRFGGVPEQGHCPGCGTLHSWMGMLQSVHTIGWGNKRRGRHGRKVPKVDKAALPPNAETELHVEEPAPAGKGRKRAAKALKATPTAELASQLELLTNVVDPSLGASLAHGQLVAVAAIKGKAAGRKGRTADPGGAGTGCELGTERQADGGAAVRDSALQQAGPKKRAVKPRAPRSKAGATTAGVGDTVLDGAGGPVPAANKVHLTLASGAAAEVGVKLMESPPKRPREGRRAPARHQDAQPQQDTPRPWAALPHGAFRCPVADTEEQDHGTCDATHDKEDASPIPLWRRLQTRACGARTTVTAALTRDLPAVPGWHSQAACLESASYSIITNEDADDPLDKPSATCGVGLDEPGGATTHRRAITVSGNVFVIDVSSTDEPDKVDEGSEGCDSDSDEGVEALGNPPQSGTAGNSVDVSMKVLRGADAPAAHAITPQQAHVPSSRAAVPLPPPSLDHQPAPSSPEVLLAVLSPPATRRRSPPPSPMDTSSGLQHKIFMATVTEAAPSPTHTPLETFPPTRPFGSPAWCLTVSDSSPASASDQAGGSTGGAVTALMSQLRCSGCTSPPGNQSTSSSSAPAPLGDVAFDATADGPLAPKQDSDGVEAPISENCAAATEVPTAAGAAGNVDAQTGCAAPVFPSQCTNHTHVLKGTQRQTVVAEVVDLCSPLPLSSRLAHRVGAAGAPGPAAAGLMGSGPAGKRLRSPKLPTMRFAGGTAGDLDGGVLKCSEPGAEGGRTHGLDAAHGARHSFAASVGTAIHDTTWGVHHNTEAAGDEHADQATGLARPLPEEGKKSGRWSVSPWPIRQRRERGGSEGNSGLQESGTLQGEEPEAGGRLQGRTPGLRLVNQDLEVLQTVGAGAVGVPWALGGVILQGGSVSESRDAARQWEVCASSDDDVIIID